MRVPHILTACAVLLGVATMATAADSPLSSVSVYPDAVKLSTKRDRQSLIVQATFANGLTRDVTGEAKFSLADDKAATLSGHLLTPKADGKSELTVTFGGKTVKVPIEVEKATDDRPISFRLDVMPVFMKANCNTGSCHGSARGKDGFRLSLFGFDPAGDHYRLTRELPGRRINLAVPSSSLVMEKSVGAVPHTGGRRFNTDSELYGTLDRWLKAGAPNDPGAVPAVTKVELFPKEAVLDGEGVTQQLNVLAHYADGTTRDVTSLAFFMTSNATSAEIEQSGTVTAHARGEAFVMARFETHTTGSRFIVLPKGLKYDDPKTSEVNYVDSFIHQKLRKLRIIPSEICNDEIFLRRAYLDVIGVLPTADEYWRFMRKTPAAETFLAEKTKLQVEAVKAEAEKKTAAEAAAKAVAPTAVALEAAQKVAAAAKDEGAKKAGADALKKATDAKAAAEKASADATKAADDALLARQAADSQLALAKTGVEYSKLAGQAKREKLVDELLNRKEFVEMWVMKWAELLTIRTTQQVSYKPMLRYYNWLNERIANNVPIDVMCQELLGANGGTFANAATNYYQNETNTLKVAENVAQVFMGMRIQCTQCHNHPFDRWTMDDYYSFAAFFAQIGRKRGEDPREIIIFNSGSGEVKHLVGGRVMKPKYLGGEAPDTAGKDRRVMVANWLASDKNPYFARNLANIVWAHFMGKGIINEVDDVRVSNPPVNEPLLAELATKFSGYKYDFKKLVRDICVSRTYQLATQTNKTNEKDGTNFSHGALRRMRAEVLFDSISQVTDTKNKFGGLPLGARAVQIANGNTSNYFLTTFGRAKRESVCACEVKMEPNLSQALHLLNGDTVNNKIKAGNVLGKLTDQGLAPNQVINELYVRCLSRLPTDKELQTIKTVLDAEKDKKSVLEDVFWSLLNSREFLFNH
ncbi:MAG: DUF1549 domain-containing protein [Planctomycetota bacterium]|nr:DUF1549 domain-containing protein [Planctomycetota bacterium]